MRWEQGNWSAYDIDFSADVAGWSGLSDIQRRSAMWIYSMFFYGEDRVADTLAPYITAAPTEEQAYFLATQQVDEVRHSLFFHRFFKEVIGVGGESIQETLASTLPQLNWGYLGVFDRLDRMARRTADRHLAAEVRAGDHALPPDRRGQPRPAGPALHRGLLRLAGDDARVQRRDGERLPRRAAPHRLRRQSAVRTAGAEPPRLGRMPRRRGRAAERSPPLQPRGLPAAEPRPRLHRVLRLLARGHLHLRAQTGAAALADDRLPDRGDAGRRLPLRPGEVGGADRRRPGEDDARRHPRAERRQRPAEHRPGADAPLLRHHRPRRQPERRERHAARLPVEVQRRRPAGT